MLAPTDLKKRLAAAQAAAAEAGRLACSYLENPERLKVTRKGVQDFVTAADVALEKLIVQRLQALFPGDAFLGEESKRTIGKTPPPALWIIDPIDGTSNFAAGRRDWCVSIGFMNAGKPAVGVIDIPTFGEQYSAMLGAGATCNGRPIRTSARRKMSEATFGVDYSFRTPPKAYLALLDALLKKKSENRRNGSAAVLLAQVARGELDGFAELHLYPWDVLAGMVLVTEAGGWVNDFFAGDGLRKGGPMIAAAPGVKAQFLAAIGTIVRKYG